MTQIRTQHGVLLLFVRERWKINGEGGESASAIRRPTHALEVDAMIII